MNEKDYEKANRNVTFLAEHELSQDELERLIENKFKRARAYSEAFRQREEDFLVD